MSRTQAIAIVWLHGAGDLAGVTLFLVGIICHNPAAWVAGGLIMVALTVWERAWRQIRSVFGLVVLAALVALFVHPWYLACFWVEFGFRCLNVPTALYKVIFPVRFAEKARRMLTPDEQTELAVQRARDRLT